MDLSRVEFVTLGVWSAADEALSEYDCKEDNLKVERNQAGEGLVCRLEGSGPVVARLLVNVNLGELWVDLHLHAEQVEGLVKSLLRARGQAKEMDGQAEGE